MEKEEAEGNADYLIENFGILAKTSVIATRLFDINAPDLDDQVTAFIDNQLHTLPPGQ